MMERVGDRQEKMEESCSTGQSPQRAVLPIEEEEEEEWRYFGDTLFLVSPARHGEAQDISGS
jgi:hypothetical protein